MKEIFCDSSWRLLAYNNFLKGSILDFWQVFKNLSSNILLKEY